MPGRDMLRKVSCILEGRYRGAAPVTYVKGKLDGPVVEVPTQRVRFLNPPEAGAAP
jgi:hypothetical protein